MGSYVKLVALGAVGYVFQIVMGNGVFVGIRHEIGKCFLLPVEEVQASSLGANPDILVLIFCHVPDKGETDTIVSGLIRRIEGEKVHFGIEIMNTSVISSQPDTSLTVFINRENGGVGETARKVISGIDLEMIVMRIIFIQSGKSPYPEISEVVFHDASDLVAGYIVGFLRIITEAFKVAGRFSFIKSVHSG